MSSHGWHHIPEHVHWRRFDSELVVLDTKASEYYGLNDVAADAFEGLAAGRTIKEVLADLLNVYEVDASRLEHDVHDLVKSLRRRGLLIGMGDEDPKAGGREEET